MVVKTAAIIPTLAKISFSLLVSPSHSRPGSSGIPLNTEDRGQKSLFSYLITYTGMLQVIFFISINFKFDCFFFLTR